MDGDRRYVMLRADVLMGAFSALPIEWRQVALESLAASTKARGGLSARAYFDAAGGSATLLLDAIAKFSPQLGWGCWRFIRYPDGALGLTVEDSPFAEGFGVSARPVCYPIVGMLQAVGELVFAQAVDVVETHCSAQPHSENCVFRAAPVRLDVPAFGGS